MKEKPVRHTKVDLTNNPEELIYRSCYATAALTEMLETAELRSAIRRLPPAQFFFSLKELDEAQIADLLPHITEEQWSTVLDLDLWTKDEMNSERFVEWQQHMLASEDAVGRKLLRATDLEAWALALKNGIQVYERGEDGEFSEEAVTLGQFETPDNNYLIGLPRNPEKARLYHQLIQRLYQLDAKLTIGLINACRFQTSMELEEDAYQNRRRRIEDLGFQDYFQAIEVYSYRDCAEVLPRKRNNFEVGSVPARLSQKQADGPLLLFRALAAVEDSEDTQHLVEELFYVCNKLLTADQVSPDEVAQVKKGILKAISCLNLGLDCWSGGDLGKAIEGISIHYLLSFFQIGFGQLTDLKQEVQSQSEELEPIPGSFLEAAMDAIVGLFPELAEQVEGKIRTRFFQTSEDLGWGRQLIEQLSSTLPSEQ